ncbi:cobaltochelatase subunit CobN [Arcobacter sp. LA11]|uniref:cobaltochelatase subunit CobN n=1 Tax=Arcobacter sp. LA11 TaxID=1898176 RepID=UPI000933F69D|nr:cobaltochelatase subunit CobN [Arcobacter sp. LA11]
MKIKVLFLILYFFSISLFAKNDVLIISSTMGQSTQASKAVEVIDIGKKKDLDIKFLFQNELKKENQFKELSKYKIIMIDSLAGSRSINSMLEQYKDVLIKLDDKKIIIPISIKKENPYRKNISIEDNILLNEYWHNGGQENFKNFVIFIQNKLLKTSNEKYKKALIVPEEGIYHPKSSSLAFNSLEEYAKFAKIDLNNIDKPVIAIGMHRGSIVSNSMAHINEMISYFEKKNYYTIPFFTNISGDDAVGKQFLRFKNKTIVDVIVNFQIMIIDHESLKDDYKKLNVPILHALYYGQGDTKDWLNDINGVNFPMIPMTFIIPETLGFTDPLIVAAQNKITKKLEPIFPQLYSLANKAINISKLKRMPNKDKKVAIMYYNYPYGVDNMGASFLNLPESLEQTFKTFKEKGYTTEAKKHEEIRIEATKGLQMLYDVNLYDKAWKMIEEDSAALFPYEDYMKEFYKLPVKTRTNMIKVWDYPLKSKSLIYKDGKWYFLVPRKKIGNILIMPQPRRAERDDSIREQNIDITRDDSRLWHNPTVPISHSYLAGYLYVRKQFKADAIVHYGTHGTQEWSPGKERGLSIGDDALSVLGDVPVVYPYITNNLAEAIQAKRRGRATLISHQTPPFGLTGTYKELSEIMDFINQYKSVDDGMLKGQLKNQITQTTVNLNVHKDVEFSEVEIKENFDAYLSKVEDYILGTSKSAMPLGMHTFGTYPKKEHLISTILQMVGSEFIQMVEGDKNFFTQNYEKFPESKSYKLLNDFVIENKDFNELEDKNLKPYLEVARKYRDSFVNTKEIKNFMRALDGEYIETGVGGDSIRNPESLPTGINMYGFDPSKVPTKAAYKTGSKLMKDFIENYYKENGKYPQKLTFNLWSLETMRHYGVLESQILYAMGVRPVWNETGISNKFIQNIVKQMIQKYLGESVSSWVASLVTVPRIEAVLSITPDDWLVKPKKMLKHAKMTAKGQIEDVEIIPYSELKRPRVDVVISATGLYRDTFPQPMQLIAKAVEKVAKLKEDNNYLRINTLAMKEKLEKTRGISKDEAEYLSTIRIFSNKPGDYGSGVDEIGDTSRWNDDQRISQNYVQKLGHYYGSDPKRWGEKHVSLDLYSKNLSGTEGIIFSRTSNLYGLLTSDDPFEYFGSIAMAVRNVDGKAPKTFIANLRDPNNAKIQSTGEFLSQELRGRYFHPKWIKEMQAEGYSGTLTVLDRMNNFWGWQVVDPNVVRDDQWQEFVEVYVNDKYDLKIQEWFKQFNPDALAQFTQKILEANRKGYFKTDENTLKKLVELYKELQQKYKVKTYNTKFKDFVDKKAIGFGLMTPSGQLTPAPTQESNKKMEKPKKIEKPKVKGQKLEKVKKEEFMDDSTQKVIFALLFGLMLAGVAYEFKRKA